MYTANQTKRAAFMGLKCSKVNALACRLPSATLHKSSTGWLLGFKLHIVINHLGELLGIKLTAGNVDDRKALERSPGARILGPVLGIGRRRWRAGGEPPKPIRPLCRGMLTHEYTYAFGAVDVCTGELNSLILPHVNTGCMQLFVNEV
jgi:hypothetical protein